MTRTFRKKDVEKTEKEKKEKKMRKEKLPYLPPTQKILDIDRDTNDIIYPPDLESKRDAKGFFHRMAAFSSKFKYRLMKKFNMPEIYTDILFFVLELFIAVLIIYIIMRVLIIFRGRMG